MKSWKLRDYLAFGFAAGAVTLNSYVFNSDWSFIAGFGFAVLMIIVLERVPRNKP